MSEEKFGLLGDSIKHILSVLMILLLIATAFVVVSAIFLPTAVEYDDPTTEEINESFPWNPDIFSDFEGVWNLYIKGLLRHISTLPEHLNLSTIINISSYAFYLIFIYGVRKEFKPNAKFQIHQYAEWGIAAIIGTIMSIVRTFKMSQITEVTSAVMIFSLSALLLYLMHPENWLKSFLEKVKKNDNQV